MKKIKIIALLLFAMALSGEMTGQDVNYSQFQNTPLYFNPAFTGLYSGMRARFSFRDQWPSLPYDFKAYQFTADIGDRSLPGAGGIGLMFNTDNEGVGFIQNLNLGIAFSVRIPFSSFMVGQLGVKASWLQKSVNWDDFVFSDALSEKYGNVNQTDFQHPEGNTVNMADFGVGAIVQFANEPGSMSGTLGFAVDHLFEPDQSFLQTAKAPIPRKYVAHADLIFAVGGTSGFNVMDADALKISPGFIYQNQGGLNAVQTGLNLTKFGIYLGLWYKGAFGTYSNGVLTYMGGYRYEFADNMNIKFTYSYDMQMTGALQGTGGAHEISLVLEFGNISLFGGAGGSSARTFQRGRGGYDSRLECSEF
jgi:type IX secretion system PorP/SprF family membrane protein